MCTWKHALLITCAYINTPYMRYFRTLVENVDFFSSWSSMRDTCNYSTEYLILVNGYLFMILNSYFIYKHKQPSWKEKNWVNINVSIHNHMLLHGVFYGYQEGFEWKSGQITGFIYFIFFFLFCILSNALLVTVITKWTNVRSI